MSAYYYSLGMILLKAGTKNGITQEGVGLLLLRNLIADEDNQ